MTRTISTARRFSALFIAGLALLQACGGDKNDSTAPTPSITISLNPTSASVAQGGSTTVTATVTGAGGFTGIPLITITGAPTGVAVAVSNIQPSGNTTTATGTVTVAATTATGTYPITITATGTGVSAATATFTLTVTAAASGGGYTLSAAPASITVTQGGAAQTSTINIARTGSFAGSVSLAVSGAPNGVTATLNPTSTTTNSSTLTVTAAAGATTGSAQLTVTGTATGVANQTLNIPITVAAATGGSGNVAIDFASCATADKPIWFAVQNGTTGWTQVTPTNDVYRFNITQTRGGIAYTTQATGGATSVNVQYFTQAEVTAGTIVFCRFGGPKTLTGTVAGLGTGDFAIVSLGGGTASPTANGAFTLNGIANGNQDLVASRYNLLSPGTSERIIIRRGLNIATGGTIPTIDFGAAEAFAPATATATVTGGGSDQIISTMQYLTGTSCAFGSLGTTLAPGSTFTMRGVPAAQQQATDFHQVFVAASSATANAPTRLVFETFHTLANRTIALGVALPTPTVTNLTAAYKRLQAVLTLPSDYQSSMTLTYSTTNRSAVVTASFGYLGSANATLAFPDFAGVGGWQDSWMPATSSTVNWTVSGTGTTNITPTSGLCVEGSRIRSATVSGTI